MSEPTEDFNNVCYCSCHKAGQERCSKCLSFHQTEEKPATHPNDEQNPSYPVTDSQEEVASIKE